jgi:hypothetical protein
LVVINIHMPTYTFFNKDTGEVFDDLMKWTERQEFLEANPHIEPIVGAPAIGDSVRLGVRRPDSGFNEVLSKIHSANYKSNLADKLSRR